MSAVMEDMDVNTAALTMLVDSPVIVILVTNCIQARDAEVSVNLYFHSQQYNQFQMYE